VTAIAEGSRAKPSIIVSSATPSSAEPARSKRAPLASAQSPSSIQKLMARMKSPTGTFIQNT
jgi:hypothetical protein